MSDWRKRLKQWGLTCAVITLLHLIGTGIYFVFLGILAHGMVGRGFGPDSGRVPEQEWRYSQETDDGNDQGDLFIAGYTFSKRLADTYLVPALPPLPQLPTTNDLAANRDFEIKRAAYNRIKDEINTLYGLCWIINSIFIGTMVGTPLYWWFYWMARYEDETKQ